MATSSIYHNVTVKDRFLSRSLITALENSKEKKCKEVVLTKNLKEIKGSDISRLFGDNDDRI